MGKVTSKLQVTVPKAIADAYGIRPGDDLNWEAAGEGIRISTGPKAPPAPLAREERLRLWEQSRQRQRRREAARPVAIRNPSEGRGWTREELYERGRPGGR